MKIIVRLQEDLVYYIVQYVLNNAYDDLVEIGRDVSKLEKVQKPFPRMTYTEY